MLLEKMQIVQINEKDVIDTIMLLLEHPLGDEDHETINIKQVAGLCSTRLGSLAHHDHEPGQGTTTGSGLQAAHGRTKRKN